MIAGNGPFPEGSDTVTLNEIDFPPSEAVIERDVPENEAVTEEGFGGKVPSSSRWKSFEISSRRQAHSAFVLILPPLNFKKGSGRAATVPKVGFPNAAHVPGVVVVVGPGTDTVVVVVVTGLG